MERSSPHKIGSCVVLLVAFCLVIAAVDGAAQSQAPSFEEIVITFEVQRLSSQDMFVQYDGETVFLPLLAVFSTLDIAVERDQKEQVIRGFIISDKNRYEIDLKNFTVRSARGEFSLQPSDFSLSSTEFYLRVDLFETLFGLPMDFDFSLLRVFMPLNKEFPAYQQLLRKAKRQKLMQQKTALRDVRELPYRREYAKGGVADWVVGTNPLEKDGQYYNVNVGGMLAGGDFYVGVAGDSRDRFDEDQLRYRWHYFLDRSPYITQVDLGEVYTTGTLGRRMTGAAVTNRPQVQRKYFQTVEISGYAGENWEIELYVDGRLEDFSMTDARGEYSFMVNVYYGASTIQLKMYGPNGEVRVEDGYVRIPHTLIPKNELEYHVSVGQADIRSESREYVQAGSYYGILSRLTAGVSGEIPLSGDKDESPLVAGEAILQLTNSLNITGTYASGYRHGGSFNYNKPSFVNINGSYTIYEENILRNPVGQESRLQGSFSVPFRLGGGYLGFRYFVSYDKYSSFKSTSMNYGFTASFNPVYLNYIGRYKKSRFDVDENQSMVSQLLISPRLLRWFRPQFRFDYDHTEDMLSRYGVMIHKRLFRTGQLTLSVERNELAKSNSIMLTFNFLTDFAQFTSRVLHAGDRVSMTQTQRGSVRFDQDGGTVLFDRRNAVGYGTAVVRPFLDDNYNGELDTGEEYIPGLRAKIQGVAGEPHGEDRIYYYDRLRAYDEYLVQIDQYSLDDPLLKPTNENYRVTLNPNVVTSIKVPLVLASEMSGSVRRKVEYGEAGVGGIRVQVVNLSKDIVSQVTTFADGEFYYLGLLPGKYRAYIDPEQLEKYGYTSQPASIEFEVEPVSGGSSVEDVNFILVPRITEVNAED
jgi:hypothetical protein